MIIRREFLKRMAFAALASALPRIPLPKEETTALQSVWENEWDPRAQVMRYQHTQYQVGFSVTKELLEDDLYSARFQKHLIEGLKEELLTRFHLSFEEDV